MLAAAANAKDLESTRRWADRMQAAGHTLKVYEYTQLLKACAPHEDDTMGRKLRDDASAIFHDQVCSNIMPNPMNFDALKCAVGHGQTLALCADLGVDIE